jgi:pilus assembly protein Flp/PilA
MWKSRLIEFIEDEEGASAIEYALVAAMVAVALVTFVTPIRNAVTAIFTSIQSALTGAAPPAGTGT